MLYQELVTSVKKLPPELRLSLMEVLAQSLRADLLTKTEQDDWQKLAEQGLNNAYGDHEPDYPASLIKEPNPAYESR